MAANDELESMCKETVVEFSRYCPEICLEGLIKTQKLQGSLSSGQYSNPGP